MPGRAADRQEHLRLVRVETHPQLGALHRPLADWGYPVVEPEVAPELRAHAARAVRACPALALWLVPL